MANAMDKFCFDLKIKMLKKGKGKKKENFALTQSNDTS